MTIASQPNLEGVVNAVDVMRAPVVLRLDDELRTAFETMLAQGVPQMPATDDAGRIIGFIDETSIAHAYSAARDRRK